MDALRVGVLAPVSLLAYLPVAATVASLKVARFMTSRINIFPISRANQGIQSSIDSLVNLQERLQINVQRGLVPWQKPIVLDSGSVTWFPTLFCRPSPVKEKVEEGVSLKKLFVAAVVIAVLYQTNVFGLVGNNTDFHLPNIPVPSRIKTDGEIIRCLSSRPTAETLGEAIKVFQCGNSPTSSLKEVKSAFRQLAKLTHPDKGGDPATVYVLQKAKDTLEKVYSTRDGPEAVRMYECLSQISAPPGSRPHASRVFQCLNISLHKHSCASLLRATNNLLKRIHWLGDSVITRVHRAFWTICSRG
jgi:hypothetical protein